MFEWIALSVICVLLIVGFIWCVWATEQHCNRLALGIADAINKVNSISNDIKEIERLLQRRPPPEPPKWWQYENY